MLEPFYLQAKIKSTSLQKQTFLFPTKITVQNISIGKSQLVRSCVDGDVKKYISGEKKRFRCRWNYIN